MRKIPLSYSHASLQLLLLLLCLHLPFSTGSEEGVHVASWNWEKVGVYITITLFVVLSGMAKMGFHHAHALSSRIPESCLLVLVGLIMGGILYATKTTICDTNHKCTDESSFNFPAFTPILFFFYLLPPIILESAYSLYANAFFDNLVTILIQAIVGTFINTVLIGGLLYGAFVTDLMGAIYLPNHSVVDAALNTTIIEPYPLSFVEIMVFSSLISAVDPVAVLAIFQEVGVNPDLYFLLFGESLLNDGVAVVFYNLMNTFAEMTFHGVVIDITQYALGVASFCTIAFGGLIIGMLIGLITALITKATTDVRVVEPLAIFGTAYLAYITAELFHWSGIISLIGCGLVQAHYALKNISNSSYTTVKYFIKMLSATSDVIIFLYLGIALVEGPHLWHTGFVLWTLVICLVCRFISVYGLSWIINRNRIKKINLQEQFIMAYGGLRGAVGFSLVKMIDSHTVPPQSMFLTTTLAVVMATIFLQGGTIKLLVNWLRIEKMSEESVLMTEEINVPVMDNIMAGIEIISGRHGRLWFSNLMFKFDERVLMKVFCNKNNQSELTKLYEKLAISDHLCNLYGPVKLLEDGRRSVLMSSVAEYDNEDDLSQDIEFNRNTSFRESKRSSFTPYPNFQPGYDSGRRKSLFETIGFGRKDRSNSIATVTSSKLSTKAEELEHFRMAINRSSYRKFHQKYNPNLIDDDDQEIDSQLWKRHRNARRMSMIVLSTPEYTEKNNTKIRNSFLNDPFSSSIPADVPPGVKALMERHQRVRARSKSISSWTPETSTNLSRNRKFPFHPPSSGEPKVQSTSNFLSIPEDNIMIQNETSPL